MDVFNSTETAPVSEVNFIKEGLKIGLINGAFAILILYVGYYMGMDAFVNIQIFSAFIPYMIIVLLIYGFQLRKKNNGFLSFKEAMQYTFMSYVVAALVLAIGTYILYNVIDPALTGKSIEIMKDRTINMMEKLKVSQDEIDKQIAQMDKEDKTTGIKKIVLGMGMGLIWDFVKSLLISIAIRKEKPAF